jgi:hypothetical protein
MLDFIKYCNCQFQSYCSVHFSTTILFAHLKVVVHCSRVVSPQIERVPVTVFINT